MEHTLNNILEYIFKDENLLKYALTHTSASPKKRRDDHFERLEFLGDRVLGLVIANFLYHKYPHEDEGVLAQYQAVLVSRDTCREVAEKIGLAQFIKYNATDYQSKNTTLLANAMEALLGAIFLDGGIEPSTHFILKHWKTNLAKTQRKDSKMTVQEWAQKKYNIVPQYTLVEQSGADHSPFFTYKLFVPPHFETIGTGNNRKQAEQDAAQKFMVLYKIK